MRDVQYALGKQGSGNEVLREGWGEPEDGFVWTEGRVARLVIPVQSSSGTISMSVWGYLHSDCLFQDILVFANGKLVNSWKISQPTVVEMEYREGESSKELEVVLFIPSATSPKATSGVHDERNLGLALSLVQVVGPDHDKKLAVP